MQFTHLDQNGMARMVDVSSKTPMKRQAKACGEIIMAASTIKAIQDEALPKGDVLTVAKIAGINAAKRNSEIIPLCHALPIEHIDVDFEILEDRIIIRSVVVCIARTGVEMEALAAVSGAALGIYDMCKALDKNMVISHITLEEKIKVPLDG